MDETSLRHQLGIPDDAGRVIIFAESSHWDPNWLKTSEEYYNLYVERNLDKAIKALQQEPRRVYSVECVFFLRMYWERRPEMREAVRELVNQGRLRLTSSGVTTADTLLPSAEAILRDLLLGQEWLRANGMTQEPRLAYFTDSFGCSPALPSLLRASGFDWTAISRIDGMYFVGTDLERAENFPRPGSSAELLLEIEKSVDFVWRDMNGAEVLCHWNAYGYFQGDMLAHRGVVRWPGFPTAIPDPSERHVAAKIARYVGQLEPYSRTPYLFCPMGMDFVPPTSNLVALLDRHNRVRYPATGVWAVNGGLDDYLALVACHRESLPRVELDPNPYWTGFYSSRPALKKRCRDLVDRLLLAERLALSTMADAAAQSALRELEAPWWDAVASNHHDFITGTSPDEVTYGEQIPWLDRALETVEGVIERLAPSESLKVERREPRAGASGGSHALWSRQDGLIKVETPHYVLKLSEDAGGSILRAWRPGMEKTPFLDGVSHDLISYRDSGGLWRMGHEYKGGYLKPGVRASHRRTPFQIWELEDGLELTCDVRLDDEVIRRTLWFRPDSPIIYGRVEGRAPSRRTVTLRFETGISAREVAMAQPGGVVTRPLQKLYQPTFWPVQGFLHLRDSANGWGVAFFVKGPTGVACHEDGGVELVALRNATRERAYRIIPLPANPATGYEHETHTFEYAILFTSAGDWKENHLPSLEREIFEPPWHAEARSLVKIEGGDQRQGAPTVIAVKPASRGEGIIARLYAPAVPEELLSIGLRQRTITSAFLCGARERDIQSLEVANGQALLVMPGSIATLRLVAKDSLDPS
jgi:hypothetical protein